MHIRSAQIADIPAIIAVERSAGTMFEGTHMAWAVGETSTEARLRTLIETGIVRVAEVDGGIAGYISGEPVDDDFHIEEVSVASAFQRRGIGRHLIDDIAGFAQSRGHHALTLTTDRTLAWNAPYYERLGFSIIADADLTPGLRIALLEKPEPDRRCAMIRQI